VVAAVDVTVVDVTVVDMTVVDVIVVDVIVDVVDGTLVDGFVGGRQTSLHKSSVKNLEFITNQQVTTVQI